MCRVLQGSGGVECACEEGFEGQACETAVVNEGGEALGTQGGERRINNLGDNVWQYFALTLQQPLPDKVKISFQTTPACEDSATFVDGYYGDLCAAWAGYQCKAQSGLTEAMAVALRANCPVSCSECPGKGAMLFARFNDKPLMASRFGFPFKSHPNLLI